MSRNSCSILVLSICVTIITGPAVTGSRGNVRKFPDGFLFGSSSGAYQVEGAWNEDGKTESIWDRFTHTRPEEIQLGVNGDVAADSYHQYKRDVEMMRELGLDCYKFSISWPRVLPTGFPDKINKAGLRYYNNLIDEMLKYNIQPIVTIYHWDIPQKLQDMGGWTNPYVIDWFGDFARIVFENFSDRVKYWITINEPREVCYQAYGGATMAPLYNYTGVADYLCVKNLLLAHAKVYHMYYDEFRKVEDGIIGITLSAQWHEPETQTENDIVASEDFSSFEWGMYAHPIFSESGDYPPVVKQRVAANSAAQGFRRSRLPELTAEEVEYVRGTSDFFGLNHYTTKMVYRNASVIGHHPSPSFFDDAGVIMYQPDKWPIGASTWLKIVPWGFYKLLMYIKNTYNNPPVFVTENGLSTTGGLEDDNRVAYYKNYMKEMLNAIDDGANVKLYAPWSLMDNFEWLDGYSARFGLYEVDITSPNRTRTPRKSAFLFKHITRTRTLDLDYEPQITTMTIDEGH